MTSWNTYAVSLLPYVISALSVAISLVASAHVVLTKRDPRAAIGWIGLIWLSPFLGTALYIVFGVNRIRRRAQSLRRGQPRSRPPVELEGPLDAPEPMLEAEREHLNALARLVGRVTGLPLLAGNEVVALRNGDEAYPAMLDAVDGATCSIALSTYIFNNDRAGRLFVEAFERAVRRGVEVRVLVDDIGARYDWPSVIGALRRAHVPVARFMPTLALWWMPYWNLRIHRKILVVDGRVGFTGGMNIDEDYLHQVQPRHPKVDLHFRVRGPVVASLQHVFSDDWVFATGELLRGETWFPPLESVGATLARGVPDGPDEDRDKLVTTLLGAISCAQSSLTVVTPYFVPEPTVLSALGVAAMRGVAVNILLPSQNNLWTVQWASMAVLRPLLEAGCRVWSTAPPFDHTKLMIVDRAWSFLGSSNWDARSFRLNFEFNLECYDPHLAAEFEPLIDERLSRARPITLEMLDHRNLAVRLRDGTARLLSPYL
jgi:cardiolipin synthase